MPDHPQLDSSLVIDYLTLRKAIGILGLALPFLLSIGALIIFDSGIQSSISSYYYTGMRDVLVGTLCAIGVFLLSYKGYERKDAIAGDLACVFAVGIALFPTTPDVNPTSEAQTIGDVHLVFASLFFATVTYFSLFLFTKTDPTKTPTRRKLQRNMVYRTCGYTMAASLILIFVEALLPQETRDSLSPYHPRFWLESIAIIAFGISWLTKGEAILKDVP